MTALQDLPYRIVYELRGPMGQAVQRFRCHMEWRIPEAYLDSWAGISGLEKEFVVRDGYTVRCINPVITKSFDDSMHHVLVVRVEGTGEMFDVPLFWELA